MTSILMTFALKFLTVDGLSQLAAKIISNLLSWASKRGGNRWEIAKTIVTKINIWSSLFL